MKSLSLMAGDFVLLAFILPASAQFHVATAGRDYSFTISTTQPWTDTGVDLQAGDVLQINSSSGETCDPAGVSGGPGAGLPVVSAPAGALIARLQAQGVPVLVGSGKQLKAEATRSPVSGSEHGGRATLQRQLRRQGTYAPAADSAAPAAGNSLTRMRTLSGLHFVSADASPPPAASSKQKQRQRRTSSRSWPAPPRYLWRDNSAPAQRHPPLLHQPCPPGSDVVAPASAPAASTTTPVALKVSSGKLDSGLEKDIDGLPRRVNDEFQNQGDMVNFVLVGSEQQVKDALDAASWRIADTDNKEAVLKAVLETYQKKDYLQMPMSTLYLFGRKQDYGYELAQAYSVVASRHHFRIWKAPATWNGQTDVGGGRHPRHRI